MGDKVFGIALFTVCAVCVPWLYYTYLSYVYFMENKPADFEYPEVKWLIVSIGGALFFTV